MGRVLGYRREAVARDAAAALGVVAALLAVHYLLPEAVTEAFVFRHARPVPYTLLTAAYVHASDAHLFGNLTGYLTGCLMAYVLCLQAGRRRWFRRTFAALVVVLPVLVNAANYAAFALAFPWLEPVSRGFSGVTAGFGGFVLVAFLDYLAARYDRFTALLASLVLVSGLLAEVHFIYAGRVSAPVWAALCLGVAALVAWDAHVRGWRVPRTRRGFARAADAVVPASLVVVTLAYFVYALFPADVVTHGRIVNVFAHAAGFVLGGALAAVTRTRDATRRTGRETPGPVARGARRDGSGGADGGDTDGRRR